MERLIQSKQEPRLAPECPMGHNGAMDRQMYIGGLFEAHKMALSRFLQKLLKSDDEVADVLQDVFLRIVRQPNPQKLEQSPRSYLFKTAHNLVRDRSRRQHARRADSHIQLVEREVASQLPSPETIVSDRQGLRLIKEAVLELKPKCREVFLLHRRSELTYGDIAAKMGISVKMVEKHISDALAHCRTKFTLEL